MLILYNSSKTLTEKPNPLHRRPKSKNENNISPVARRSNKLNSYVPPAAKALICSCPRDSKTPINNKHAKTRTKMEPNLKENLLVASEEWKETEEQDEIEEIEEENEDG